MHFVFVIERRLFIVKLVCGRIHENTTACKPYQGFDTLANIGDQTRATFAACSCATDDICHPNILKGAKPM